MLSLARRQRRTCAVTVWSAALWAGSAHAAAPLFTLHELPLPPGATTGHAFDINAAGQVGGQATIGSAGTALRWSGAGLAYESVGPGYVSGINALGALCGGNGNGTRAAAWSPAGTPIDLGTLGGNQSFAQALNVSGTVVGTARVSSTRTQAFLWRDFNANGTSDPGEMRNLGGLSPTADSTAFDVNDADVVVGEIALPELPGHYEAFVWSDANGNFANDPGELHRLGSLGGFYSRATAINALGEIAGSSYIEGDETLLAFRYRDVDHNGVNDPGEMVALPALGSYSNHGGLDIDRSGAVVGFAASPTDTRACLWVDDRVFDLNDQLVSNPAGFKLAVASAINDAGWIVGWGSYASVSYRPYLLTPVPEPGALLTLVVLGSCSARRKTH